MSVDQHDNVRIRGLTINVNADDCRLGAQSTSAEDIGGLSLASSNLSGLSTGIRDV